MSNPYIQVEIDALKKAPLLASVLGIQLREAVGGLTLLWAHVYQERADTVSGFFLRAFFGVDCSEALSELGFIEALDTAGLWRVRGAGRYTRLGETRREAGRKGGQASAQAKAGFAQANGKQTASKSQANQTDDDPDSPAEAVKQTSSKRQAKAGFAQANGKQNAPNTEQNQALEPITDSSPPTGERELSDERSSNAGEPLPASPDGAGKVPARERPGWRDGRELYVNDLPRIERGTPEYDAKVAASKAAGWG